MKLLLYLLVPFLYLSSCSTTKSEQSIAPNPQKTSDQISTINSQINQWHQHQNLDSLIGLYHPEITFCAEYKPVILNKDRLQQFYTDWWQINTIKNYQKDIYEIQSFGNYVLEDGHFTIDYLDAKNERKQYDGMYLVIWKQDPNGQLRMLSEGFCSDKYRQAKEMPYADIDVFEQLDYPQKDIPKRLAKMVNSSNDALIKIVEAGDSEARIKGFTDDAVYLHHYHKMMVGMDVLKPYLRKTYTPEAEIFVSHKLGRTYDLGNKYVLVNGHYKGGWAMNGGGTFEGNFIKIQREGKDGILRTYRSWTNNDR